MRLKNCFRVYRQDWKRILKNPVAFIIIAGLCILPSLYAWVNIQACWNVYENTNSIPVAVVNNDQDALLQGKTINVGSKIVDQLKQNNKIKWVFTSSVDADFGLMDSTYYAVIEIPSDFSAKLLTILTDNPQKPQIIYKADTKANPVAGKITSAASNTLIQQVSEEFVSTVNETVFQSLNIAGNDAGKNTENVLKVKDSVIEINRNMDVITSLLQSVETNSDNLNQYLSSIDSTMPSVREGLASIQQGNTDNQEILQSMKTQADNSTGCIELNLKYAQIANEKIRSLFGSLNTAAGSAALSNGNTVLPTAAAQLSSMSSSIDAVIDYLKQCSAYSLDTENDEAITALTNLKTSLTTARKALVDFQNQLKTAQGTSAQWAGDMEQKIAQTKQVLSGLDQSLSNAAARLKERNQSLNAPALTQALDAIQDFTLSTVKEKLNTAEEALRNAPATAQGALSALDGAVGDVIGKIDTVNGKIDAAVGFLQSAESANAQKKQQINKEIQYLQSAKSSLTDEQTQLSAAQSHLASANTIAKDTADQLNNDGNQVASQLDQAMKLYHSDVQGDIRSIGNDMMSSVKDASALIKNAQDLCDQISSTVQSAKKGSELASDFSHNLKDKLADFQQTIQTLGSQLEKIDNSDIAEIISTLQNDPKLMGEYVSNPFDIQEESINPIPNYGSGMAPIYTTLALWVGCLVLNSILKMKVARFDGSEHLTLHEKYFGKMMLFSTLAVVQGLVVSLGDILIMKIYVVNPVMFVFFSVFSSFVFSIITYTLASTLGNIGKALAILYLILQVAGSGGSYPVEVVPQAFRILQPLFPFTYTLGGLREAIAGPLAINVILNITALIIFAVLFLAGGYLTVKPLNTKLHKFEHSFKKSGIGE